MQTNNYPYSVDAYFDQHPEKFQKRRQPQRIAMYAALIVVGVIVLLFPGLIPFFKLWLVYVAGVAAIGCGAIYIWTNGSAYFNIATGGEIKDLEVKKFRNSRDERVFGTIMEAFEKHDFKYLSEAPSANNQPLQLWIYEDKKGREFYLLMKCYTSNGYESMSDVVIISGKEYDQNADLIRSMETEDSN